VLLCKKEVLSSIISEGGLSGKYTNFQVEMPDLMGLFVFVETDST
jgi:hypothetical protein